MNPVDSNAGNGFINVPYPLDLVNQAREVMLGANRELFLADTAGTPETPVEFSQLSVRLSVRLDNFSTLLSSFDFFSKPVSPQSPGADAKTKDSAVAGPQADAFLDEADKAFSSPGDLDAREQSVRTVIDAYNGLIEWLDNSEYAISPSLKTDMFKEMNSSVLKGIIPGTSAVRENAGSAAHAEGTASYTRQADRFSPQISGPPDSTVESALSEIGLTLNADGTLDVGGDFGHQFKTRFSRAHDILSGERGFFTKINGFLDSVNNRDSRFNIPARNDTPRVYTGNADVQVHNAYRTNVASLLNTFA